MVSPLAVGLKPDAIVFDNERQVFAAQFEQNVDRSRARMLGNIVQRFLGDTVDACLHFGSKSLQIAWSRVEHGRDAGVARPLFDIGLEHSGQAKFVQRRWSQFPGNEVDVLSDTRQHLQGACSSRRLCAPISVEGFEHQPEGGQSLTEAIVEVLGESTPFILLGDDEPAEQPRSRCFGLRPISDLRGQQGPRFRQLAARLSRRCHVGGGVFCQASVGGRKPCHR